LSTDNHIVQWILSKVDAGSWAYVDCTFIRFESAIWDGSVSFIDVGTSLSDHSASCMVSMIEARQYLPSQSPCILVTVGHGWLLISCVFLQARPYERLWLRLASVNDFVLRYDLQFVSIGWPSFSRSMIVNLTSTKSMFP